MKQTNVLIIYTGGTIGMALKDEANPDSPLIPKPFVDLMKWIPSWEVFNEKKEHFKQAGITLPNGITLDFIAFDPPLDSSNITPEDWVDIVKKIEFFYDDYDGFVILHGTDTLAYTSSALSFMLEHLAKPVVVTGSQLPISNEKTDAVINLVNSVHIAGWVATGLPCIPEVIVCFADKLLRGCRATKVSSTAWAGFDSPNFPPLGRIGESINIDVDLLRAMPEAGQVFQVNTALNTNVMDVILNPGMKATQLEQMMLMRDVDAILLRTYGAGNAPEKSPYLDVIDKAHQANKPIVNITQCAQGMVDMGRYGASVGMLERGVISGFDMTGEAALAKLYFALGGFVGDKITSYMQVCQRGEQGESLFELKYGHCGDHTEVQSVFESSRALGSGFIASQLSRAVIRFKGLGFYGLNTGDCANIHVFINQPAVKLEAQCTDLACVAIGSFTWEGETINDAIIMDDIKRCDCIGQGEVSLSVRADDGVAFWFEGLCLSLFVTA